MNIGARVYLHLPFLPLPWKAPIVGSHGAFSPRYGVIKQIKEEIRKQYKESPLTGYISINFQFYMAIPKSASKKQRKLMLENIIMPESQGDLTNLQKLIEDCLQGIVIVDDKQVVSHGLSVKYYSENPATILSIYESARPELTRKKNP